MMRAGLPLICGGEVLHQKGSSHGKAGDKDISLNTESMEAGKTKGDLKVLRDPDPIL